MRIRSLGALTVVAAAILSASTAAQAVQLTFDCR